MLETLKDGLTSHAVIFEDLQTKSLNHIDLLGKSDSKDPSPLKSTSATVILTENGSHSKGPRKESNVAKVDEGSHTSVQSLSENKEATTGVSAEVGEAETEESQPREEENTTNSGEMMAEELRATESVSIEAVQREGDVAGTVKELETPVEETQTVESTNETVESVAKQEVMSTEVMSTEGVCTPAAAEDASKGPTTNMNEQSVEAETRPVDETLQQTKSEEEDKASLVTSEDAVNEKENDLKLDQSKSCTTSQAELNKAPSAAMGSTSSLGKREGNSQMVEKIEIDHSTGQSQASLVEAVEKATPPPVVTNT